MDRRKVLALGMAVCVVPMRLAASTHVMVSQGLALGGIDPLSYLVDGGPRSGDPAHRVMWRDAIWQFRDADRQAAFERDPVTHAPAYGGYCAYGLSRGSVIFSNPAIFTIVDDRLFLNQSNRSHDLWLGDMRAHIAAADALWPQILG